MASKVNVRSASGEVRRVIVVVTERSVGMKGKHLHARRLDVRFGNAFC